jgi:EmrB/QacA subfamily drug resistance transporter
VSVVAERLEARPSSRPNPWATFGLACVAQFMVVLDASIINVALPSIQRGLSFSLQDLQWVVNIYVLMFGGFLLLGGRAGDLFGRRRLFIVGLALFSAASLAGGFAQNAGWLVVARGAQGLGGAIISPIALSIVTGSFSEGSDRNRALGIYGSIAGFAGACGVLLGGILTSSFGWQWVLFVNVPVGIAAAALAPMFIPDDAPADKKEGFDLLGASTVTAALIMLVYGVVKAPTNGWGSVQTIGFLTGAAVLLAAFIAIELRASEPLVRLGIFRLRSLTITNAAGLLTGSAMFAMFFFISLYLQNVLGYSALDTGFAYLPMAVGIIVAAGTAAPLVTRFGFKPILIAGLIMASIGLAMLARLPVHGAYWSDVFPAVAIIALGLGLTFVPLTIASVQGVSQGEIGLASGLINTSLQVGGALGLAVLSTISTSRFNDVIKTLRGRDAYQAAVVDGFHYAFVTGAALLVVGALALVLLLPRRHLAAPTELDAEAVTIPA